MPRAPTFSDLKRECNPLSPVHKGVCVNSISCKYGIRCRILCHPIPLGTYVPIGIPGGINHETSPCPVVGGSYRCSAPPFISRLPRTFNALQFFPIVLFWRQQFYPGGGGGHPLDPLNLPLNLYKLRYCASINVVERHQVEAVVKHLDPLVDQIHDVVSK